MYGESHVKDKMVGRLVFDMGIPILVRWHGGYLNIKMSSYQYKDSYYKDKKVSRPSYLYNENPHTWKNGLYIVMGPRCPKQKQHIS